MASVQAALPFVICMVIFGSLNTILTAWQNSTEMTHSPKNAKGEYPGYDQAVIQTSIMLIGETLCFFVYISLKAAFNASEKKKLAIAEQTGVAPSDDVTPLMDGMLGITHNRSHPPLTFSQHFLLALPAACDTVGTCLQMAGLAMTSGSTYQMLRGFVIVVTAIFGRIFLGHKIYNYKIVSMVLMVMAFAWLGFVEIKLTDDDSSSSKNAGLGIPLLLVAQIFPAIQFILEEKLLSQYALAPVKAVALEGISGILILVALVPILNVALKDNEDFGRYFDMDTAINESFNWYPQVRYLHISIMFCIAIFNCMSLAVTRLLNSGMRATLDSLRTVVVWTVCCAAGLEKFNAYKIPGFVVLTVGIFIFNDIIVLPVKGWRKIDFVAAEGKAEEAGNIENGLLERDGLGAGYDDNEKKNF